jgi:hypothetical protein
MKRYYLMDNVGSAKYTVNFHDGQSKHKDGSDFFDIKIFKSKKAVDKFVLGLHRDGYVYSR